MTDEPTIEERENGPLVIKGLRSMRGPDGQKIDVKPVMALCRCGGSKSKPFCDGSHKDLGFQSRGGKPAGIDRVIEYIGSEVSVSFNPLLCSHAAECGRIASDIFNPAQRPWIQPDNGTVDQVREVVAACPSGALALTDNGARVHLVADRAEIEVEKNGPYRVLDVPSPVAPQSQGMSERKYVLCRCGQSGNKPFCDGTHRDIGWKDE